MTGGEGQRPQLLGHPETLDPTDQPGHHEEKRPNGLVDAELISALTDAIVSVYGEWARPLAVVELIGVPHTRLGMGGEVAVVPSPAVTLSSRERVFEAIDDAPTRLIGALTDAITAVFGHHTRPHVTVTLIGIPAGRSGVGGERVT